MHLPAFTGILKQANRSFAASNKPSTHALKLRPCALACACSRLRNTNLHTWQNRGHRKMAISLVAKTRFEIRTHLTRFSNDCAKPVSVAHKSAWGSPCLQAHTLQHQLRRLAWTFSHLLQQMRVSLREAASTSAAATPQGVHSQQQHRHRQWAR